MNFYWYSQNWNRQIDRLTDQQTNRPSYRDAMMHIVSLVYFLTYLLKNIEFPWFWQKHHGPTDGRTNGPTDPLIEMRGRPWIIVAIALGRAAIHVEAAAGCKSGSIANPVQPSSESPLESEFSFSAENDPNKSYWQGLCLHIFHSTVIKITLYDRENLDDHIDTLRIFLYRCCAFSGSPNRETEMDR